MQANFLNSFTPKSTVSMNEMDEFPANVWAFASAIQVDSSGIIVIVYFGLVLNASMNLFGNNDTTR